MRKLYVFAKPSGFLGFTAVLSETALRHSIVRSTVLITAFLLVGACVAAFAQTVVVPNLQATVSGNVPITVGSKANRIQQVIGSGQFPGAIVITGIRVRPAPGTGPVSFDNASYKITLSTTQAYPNTNNGHTLPSVTYANNVGPDATVVYNAAVSGSSPGCAAPGPCPFDLAIAFTTPFSFDPSKGRLLVDLVNSAATGTPAGKLDGVGFPDSTSSTIASVSGDPTQPTGTLLLVGLVLGLDTSTPALTSSYYFPQIAFGGGWQTTATYVNYSQQSVTCQTTFYADSGAPLLVPFGGTPVSSRIDELAPGADLHQQTSADIAAAVSGGWAVAACSAPIKASMLYRFYKQGVAQGEAGVNAMTAPATEFVTFAETKTGIAYANPSTTAASVTVTVLSSAGLALGSKVVQLAPNAHGAANLGPLLGLNSFTGSVQITSAVPIVSLSLNAEAFPVFSALPPGDLPSGTPLATGH
jgi:hypothetical protein